MTAPAKRIYILIIKLNKLFSFFSSWCFLKEIENMYTRENLGELEKAVETLACGSCSHSISRSPKLPLVFVRNMVVFYFFNNARDVTDIFAIDVTTWIQVYYKHLRNRKHVPCFYRVIQTRVEVWENEKCCGNTSRRRVFPQLFRVLPNFHECLYNSIETRSTSFLFLLENTTTRKRKTTC